MSVCKRSEMLSMGNIAILAGGDCTLLTRDHDAYVGVDGGCLKLLEQGLPLELAVGDFDSVSQTDLNNIKAQAKQVVQSVPEKNDTDLELALKAAFEAYPNAAVTVYGAFGGRLDHFLSNIFLPTDPDLAPYMQQIQLVDGQNRLLWLPRDPARSCYVLRGFHACWRGSLRNHRCQIPLTSRELFSEGHVWLQ